MSFAQLSKKVTARNFTYQALLTTLLAVCSLNIKHQDVPYIIGCRCHPESLGCLLAFFFFVHDIKLCFEEKIENSA